MGRKRQSRELAVAMNGHAVGRLVRASQGLLRFRYDPAWLAQPGAVPISLSMPLSPDTYSGDVVWNYFDNLLPDSGEIRARLQSVLGAESVRPFDLLERIGRDCVGALQLYPDGETPPEVREITADRVGDARIAERLRSYRSRPLGMTREEQFRISIAGAQEKTALLWHGGAWHEPRGATPTTHILKPPAQEDLEAFDINEHFCLKLARELGLEVAASTVQTFAGPRAFTLVSASVGPLRLNEGPGVEFRVLCWII